MFALAFYPYSHRLVTGCKDGSVWLWNTEPKASREGFAVRRSPGIRYILPYLPDGESLAVVNLSGSVSLWDAQTNRYNPARVSRPWWPWPIWAGR
ncbi:MAG: hypothetical protein KA354_23310 [Phycisphaerae bacterium]|nr:hypothetical protein [Phycisphaerae bacterium]